MQFREFSGNVAHSNIEGLMLDRGTNAQGRFNLGGNTHLALADPGDTNSARLDSVFKDMTLYKSRGAAIWARGEHHIFDGLKIADSAIGYTHAYPGVAPFHGDYTSKVINSLFVGESDNTGTPTTDAEKAYGRTLPRADADYPVRGYEYYDFLHHVVNTRFVNFQDNATRKSGAISYLLYTSFPVSSNNSVERVTFEMPSRRISHRRSADGPSPVSSTVFQAGMARCSRTSTARSVVAPIPTSSSTMGSRLRPMTKTAESSPPGTLPCARVIWVGSR
jgi:cell migration-inducing and hyaluronan-binding protein